MYAVLYDVWQQERAEETPVHLTNAFWMQVQQYVRAIQTRLEQLDAAAITTNLTRQELRNVRYMIHDIFQQRQAKLIKSVYAVESSPEWTEAEAILLDRIKGVFAQIETTADNVEKGTPQPSVGTPSPAEEAGTAHPPISEDSIETAPAPLIVPKYLLVRFNAPLQSITGLDLRPYGPFQPEDLATLPIELARPLLQRNIAVEIRQGRS